VPQGLGNKFLSHIREVDSIVQVVRCFEDSDIVHVNGAVDPASDIDIINLELALADLSQVRLRNNTSYCTVRLDTCYCTVQNRSRLVRPTLSSSTSSWHRPTSPRSD